MNVPPTVPVAPDRRHTQVDHYLAAIWATERQLHGALILVSERHERNYELAHGATTLAVMSADKLTSLRSVCDPPRSDGYEPAQRLRAALFGGTRVGAVGELADLCDLATLVQHAEMLWTILVQGAKELHDDPILDVASQGREQTRRQAAWVRTMIEHEAPDAIAVVSDRVGQLATSVPMRAGSIAAIPDGIWGPMAAAFLILVVGTLGVLVGLPWLVPSIGPTAVLVALSPTHPTARPWNTVVGHTVGLLAGFAAVALLGAATAPTVLGEHQLVPVRVAAAVIAIALTTGLGYAFRASHPPAAATTMLVALGAIATLEQGVIVFIGVLLTAAVGEALRKIRVERVTPAERMAPRRSIVRQRLRAG